MKTVWTRRELIHNLIEDIRVYIEIAKKGDILCDICFSEAIDEAAIYKNFGCLTFYDFCLLESIIKGIFNEIS